MDYYPARGECGGALLAAPVENLFERTNRERPEIESLSGYYTDVLPPWFVLQVTAFVVMLGLVGPARIHSRQ